MFNSLYIFILRINNKTVSEGQFLLAIIELLVTLACVGIIRNT